MSSNLSEDAKRLRDAVVASKAEAGASSVSIEHYNRQPSKVKPLFAVAEAVWNGSAEPIAGITHPDILRFLLQIDSVCCEAALCNIACINAGKINGKMALYCVSELRAAITRLSSQASQDRDLVEETIHSVLEIGRALTAPILEGGYDLHSYTTCLELLPVVVETLATLQRFDVHSGGDYLAHEMLLNDVFGVQWEGALVLPLSSILCELYPHLSKDNLRSFEEKLTSASNSNNHNSTQSAQSAQSEDFAGVIRVALRLFEQSNDTRWVHVLRKLYKSVPTNTHTYDSVQTLLEQILSESLHVAKLLLSVLEDMCVVYGSVAVRESCFRQTRSVHGVEVVCVSDVRLALVVVRSICSGSGSGSMNAIEEMPLPLLLQSTQDVHHAQAVYDSLLCSRSVCMLLLTCVALQVAEQVRYEQYNAQSAHNVLCSVVSSVLYMTRVGGRAGKSNSVSSAGSASSSGFLTAARVQEVIRAVLVLAAFPDIAQSCGDTVNEWFADTSSTNKGSEGVVIKVEGESKVDLPLVELPPTTHILQTILCHVYTTVDVRIRPALTTCVMKGIVQCATYTPINTTTTNTSTAEHGENTQIIARNARSANNKTTQISDTDVDVEVQPLHNMLQTVLNTLCITYTECFTETCEKITPHYTALLLTAIPTSISRVQHSLIHCCYASTHSSTHIFGMLQSSLQKHVQSSDPRRQLDSLRSLVFLLFSVPGTSQAQVLKTIEYGLNRNAVFSREICVLLVCYLKQMESVQSEDDTNTNAHTTSGNTPVTIIHRLTDTTLRALRDVVVSKLNTYCVDYNDTEVFDAMRCVGGIRKPRPARSSGSNTEGITTTTSSNAASASAVTTTTKTITNTTPTTTTSNTTTNTTTNTTHAHITITEDIGHLLQLCYTLDILIDSECTVQDIHALCEGDSTRHTVTSPSVVFMKAVLQAVKTGLHTHSTTNNTRQTSTNTSTTTICNGTFDIDSDGVVDVEVQVCLLLCLYSAIGGIVRCMLESCVSASGDSDIAVCSYNTGRSGSNSSNSSSRGGTGGTYSTVADLMAIQDTLMHLTAHYKLSDVTSFKSLECYYNTKMTGSEVCSIVYSRGSSASGNTTQSVLSVSPLALQRWLQFVHNICIKSAGVLPMSAQYGVYTYTAYLVRITSAQSTFTTYSTTTTTTTAANTTNNATNNTSNTNTTTLFHQLLALYKHTVQMPDESATTTLQQQQIKQYCKYLRKIHNPIKSRKSKSGHKRRKKVRSGDSVSSGEILSESESESDDEVEVVKEVDVETESVRFSPSGRNSGSSGGSSIRSSGSSVDFVIDHATTDTDNTAKAALPLLCALLCNLHSTVQGVYSRWDTHIVHHNVKPQHVHLSPYSKYATHNTHYPTHYPTHYTQNTAHNAHKSTSNKNTDTSIMDATEAGRILLSLNRRDVYGEVRSVLFSLRSELLQAMSSILSVSAGVGSISSGPDGSSAGKSGTDAPLTPHYCAELCTFIANEVKHSMQAGLTPRVFNAYTQLLQSLLTTITTTTITTTTTANTALDTTTCTSLRCVSGVLWGALREWQYPDTRIVNATVHLALKFSHVSGSTADLTQCMQVLQSIGHQHYGGSGGSGSGGGSNGGSSGKGHTSDGSGSEDCEGSGSDDETIHNSSTSNTEDTTSSTAGKDKYSVVVHSKIADQVVKEVLNHLHGTFSDTIKVQQSLSTVPSSIDDANSSKDDENTDTDKKHTIQIDPLLLTTATLSNTTGNVLNALYSLFDAPHTPTTNPTTTTTTTTSARNSDGSDADESESDIDVITTTNKRTKAKNNSTSSNKKARTSSSSTKKTVKSKNPKKNTTNRVWLIDSLSGRRGLDTVALINKLNTQCVKECSALLHAARHLRKVCAYVVHTSKMLRKEREESALRNGFSSDEEEEEREEERHRGVRSWNHHITLHKHHHFQKHDGDGGDSSGSESGTSSTSSSTSSPDPIQLQLHRLGSATSLVHCTTLFALLGSVAPQSVSDYLAWLEEQPPSKHTQRAVTVVEDLKMKLFYVLQELHSIPSEEEMLGVKDPRLLSLLHYVHHEHLRRVLELVNKEGSGLLLCLQGPAEESDGEMSDGERDLRDFGRKTVTKGRTSLLLRGAPRSSKISAVTAHMAERAAHASKSRKGNANKTIRVSRNSGLNEMFQKDEHTGDDTYADLEDFIAPNDEEV